MWTSTRYFEEEGDMVEVSARHLSSAHAAYRLLQLAVPLVVHAYAFLSPLFRPIRLGRERRSLNMVHYRSQKFFLRW